MGHIETSGWLDEIYARVDGSSDQPRDKNGEWASGHGEHDEKTKKAVEHIRSMPSASETGLRADEKGIGRQVASPFQHVEAKEAMAAGAAIRRTKTTERVVKTLSPEDLKKLHTPQTTVSEDKLVDIASRGHVSSAAHEHVTHHNELNAELARSEAERKAENFANQLRLMHQKAPSTVHVIEHEGKLYLGDGHHRAAAAIALNQPLDVVVTRKVEKSKKTKKTDMSDTQREFRYDLGGLDSPTQMPNGWLRVDGYLTKVGVFEYVNGDGTKRLELRSDDEVNKSLTSFGMVPVTDDHPDVVLDSTNTTKYQKGTVSEAVRRDGEAVRASMLITDGALAAKMHGGKCGLSCGYEVDLDKTSGNHPVYGRYDAIQRNIRGNHVAVVTSGRAGPVARVRMDAAVQVEESMRSDTGEKTKHGKDGRFVGGTGAVSNAGHGASEQIHVHSQKTEHGTYDVHKNTHGAEKYAHTVGFQSKEGTRHHLGAGMSADEVHATIAKHQGQIAAGHDRNWTLHGAHAQAAKSASDAALHASIRAKSGAGTHEEAAAAHAKAADAHERAKKEGPDATSEHKHAEAGHRMNVTKHEELAASAKQGKTGGGKPAWEKFAAPDTGPSANPHEHARQAYQAEAARNRARAVGGVKKDSATDHTPAEQAAARTIGVAMNDEMRAALADSAAQKARADALEDELASEKSRADAAEGACDALKAQLAETMTAIRTDGPALSDLENQVKVLIMQVGALKDDLSVANDPGRRRADVRARVKLETAAAAILGDKFNADSMDDKEILHFVLEKLHGPIPKDRSEEYLRARFDAAVEGYFASEAALARARDALRVDEAHRADSRTAREKMVQYNRNRSTREEK